jgi:hypothetical protein
MQRIAREPVTFGAELSRFLAWLGALVVLAAILVA